LWLYNLHYFDDLNAADADSRTAWHASLVERWIAENPAGIGVGWEPYPLSLRIVNWVKWSLAGNELSDRAKHSLAVQARYLSKRLEVHLLGNHLFANAKALVFAGAFFEGAEADGWLRLGMDILNREIPEQILPDGGHFERSTMYHALAFEDMLDLVNLAHAFPTAFRTWQTETARWPALAAGMGRWLNVMCHPDGEISFFNDAAIGIAPSPENLLDYAQRLHVAVDTELPDGVIWLKESGYIRAQKNGAVLLADVAPVGPDYLPGHAHADTLSFEFSLDGKRIIVNSGTSRYDSGPVREFERSTAAHNTVELDGESSSEVWASFRVARRAYPFDISIDDTSESIVIEAAHDGYRRLPGRAVHRRRWVLGPKRLDVADRIEGRSNNAVSRIHFGPDVRPEKIGSGDTASWKAGPLRVVGERVEARLVSSSWHPEFGLSLPSTCIEMTLAGDEARYSLEWP